MQELRVSRDRCQALTADLERSKADNIKLYEKMRFVQDYTRDRPISRKQKVSVIRFSCISFPVNSHIHYLIETL